MDGSDWEDLGEFDVSATSLVVELSDQANQFVIADAIRIDKVGELVSGPEIQVLDSSTDIADGGTVNFGSTTPNTPVTKVLTVRNLGNQNLTLSALNGGSFPTGFSLTQNLASTNLTPGGSTTFSIQMQSANEGNLSGSISFTNTDANESPFDLNLSGSVAAVAPTPAVQIIDDSASGYSRAGSWVDFVGQGRSNNLDYSAAGSGADLATWTFTVSPATYRVSATWSPFSNRATDAPYTIRSGVSTLGQVDVNQELGPNDRTVDGSSWHDLGEFVVTGSTLIVELSDDANEFVIADAIRIERL